MPNVDQIAIHGTISALGASVGLEAPGYGAVGFEVSGTFVGTLTFQIQVGGTWVSLAVATPAAPGTFVTTTTTVGTWAGSMGGAKAVRVVASLWTSGIAKIDILVAGVGGS